MIKILSLLLVWFLAVGAVLSEESVRVPRGDDVELVFEADQLRRVGRYSGELSDIRLTYLNTVADIANGYYRQAVQYGFEPVDLAGVPEAYGRDEYLAIMIEQSTLLQELINLGLEEGADALQQARKGYQDAGGAAEAQEIFLDEVQIWLNLLLEHEALVIDSQKRVLVLLREADDLWEVRGDRLLVSTGIGSPDYAKKLKAEFRYLKELLSIREDWELRDGLQAVSALDADDYWEEIEKVAGGY